MLDKLIAARFQVDFRSHAKAILEIDFPEVATQIEEVLLESTMPIEEIIGSGGGETKGAQRLRMHSKSGDGASIVSSSNGLLTAYREKLNPTKSTTSARLKLEASRLKSNGTTRTHFSIAILRTSSDSMPMSPSRSASSLLEAPPCRTL
jgi:hypothetical protein